MKVLILILFIIDVGVHLFACVPPVRRTLRMSTKVLLMPLLAGCYAAFAKSLSVPVIIALLCGCAGDVFLLWPERKHFFEAGLSAFGVGHVLYIVVFLLRVETRPPVLLLLIAVLLYAGAIVLVLRALPSDLPEPRMLLCSGYVVLICLMSLSALLYALAGARLSAALIYVGSLFFLVSDLALSYSLFKKGFSMSYLVVMTTYIAAQSLIAFGLAAYAGA